MVVGDQLTCKVIRGCKEWRLSEPDIKERLIWVNETPGESRMPIDRVKIIIAVYL